ncbi:unnamed protein product [Auanema sp. JU1783]|nr:unnamed protein product [Auanema sp. JU1783]
MVASKQDKTESRMLQLNAMNHSRAAERYRTRSLSSFYTPDENDTQDSISLQISRANSVADFPLDNRGMPIVSKNFLAGDGDFRKSFKKKIKKLAERERRETSINDISDDAIEEPRGDPTRTMARKKVGNLSRLIEATMEDNKNDSTARAVTLDSQKQHLKAARMKLLVTRAAIDLQPKLVEKTIERIISQSQKKDGDSPGAFSLHASTLLERDEDFNDVKHALSPLTDEKMKRLVIQCRNDLPLTQQLLYSKKYDMKWKNRYTDIFQQTVNGKKEKKPDNKQGWVLPLKRVCEKAGVSSRFFTENAALGICEARAQVLLNRLCGPEQPSRWLSTTDYHAINNPLLASYMRTKFDPRGMKTRISTYVNTVISDKDHIKITITSNLTLDNVYNHFVFRFEILDNQVNHIPGDHLASDSNTSCCRNKNIHCRDATRVVLSYKTNEDQSDFIHANWVQGGPLFNKFIITQAPMCNTVGDFWRMIWQEKVPYIFMLTSRKEPERCAIYWPRRENSMPLYAHGLKIENVGINTNCDPLFTVTSLRVTAPSGEQFNVEHWQGNMNNSSNILSPLNLLKIARNCERPVVVHDCLGVSRAASLVATEVAICSIIKGPSYAHLVQKAVQFVRSRRSFAVETPMQYIFIHRCLHAFFTEMKTDKIEHDYERWLEERAKRMFLEDIDAPVPGYRMLSPKVDPDLLRQVRRPRRPNYRREAPDCVGEWPLPLDSKASRRLHLLD